MQSDPARLLPPRLVGTAARAAAGFVTTRDNRRLA